MIKVKFLLWLCLFFVLVFTDVLPFGFGRDRFIIPENVSSQKLNLFDFGSNPAWMYNVRKFDYINFLSSSDNSWGNIKRRYDPEGNHITSFGFSGVTRLDNKSTFYGKSSYLFDRRTNQNRSLKYDTYSGEAFFMTDSTKGNIMYHGPEIGFIYSREIAPGLAGGLELNYAILDGLKENYSQAQSLIRKITGKFGLAYSFSDNLVWGSTIGFGDTQESIDVQGNELYSVDINNFKGDTYSILSRGNDINQKIKRKGISIGSQFYVKASTNFDFLINGEYSDYHLTNLVSNLETEDGYADFKTYLADMTLNYNFSDSFVLSNKLGYLYSQSWSEHSIFNLLLWKWHTDNLNYNLNLTYKSNNPGFLIDIDYSANYITADSSKFIDKRYNRINTLNHFIMIGAAYKLSSTIQIYSNLGLKKINIDPITGMSNFLAESINMGAGFYLTSKIYAVMKIGYSNEGNSNNSLLRKNFNSVLEVQILK